jgi:hypothetical protein
LQEGHNPSPCPWSLAPDSVLVGERYGKRLLTSSVFRQSSDIAAGKGSANIFGGFVPFTGIVLITCALLLRKYLLNSDSASGKDAENIPGGIDGVTSGISGIPA